MDLNKSLFNQDKLRWGDLYTGANLYKAAVRLYTGPLFKWRKARQFSNDRKTLYDFARHGLRNLHRLHNKLTRGNFHFHSGQVVHYNFNGKKRVVYISLGGEISRSAVVPVNEWLSE